MVPRQAGIYAQAFRFFEAFNMLGFLMAGLLLPMFSRMLASTGTGPVFDPWWRLAMRLVLTGTVAVAVFGMHACPVHHGPALQRVHRRGPLRSSPC